MVPPPISGTVQRFSYTRWLTSWRTFQSLHGVGSSHWSSPTAWTRAPNSSTARRGSSAWSGGMTRSSVAGPRTGRGGVVGRDVGAVTFSMSAPPRRRLGAVVAAALQWKHDRGLLVAQGHDGLHAGRLAGRPDAEEHPDGHADPEGQGDRPAGDGRRHGRAPPDQQGPAAPHQDDGGPAHDG